MPPLQKVPPWVPVMFQVFPLAFLWGFLLCMLRVTNKNHKRGWTKEENRRKGADESKNPLHEPKPYSARGLSNLPDQGLVNLAGIGFQPGRAAVFGMAACGQWKNELQEVLQSPSWASREIHGVVRQITGGTGWIGWALSQLYLNKLATGDDF